MNFVPLCGTKPGAMSEHPERRFPPPWTVVENAESFVVKDAKRQGAPKFDLGPSRVYRVGTNYQIQMQKRAEANSVAEEEGALRMGRRGKIRGRQRPLARPSEGSARRQVTKRRDVPRRIRRCDP